MVEHAHCQIIAKQRFAFGNNLQLNLECTHEAS